jgi:sugar diacid utilization regulator
VSADGTDRATTSHIDLLSARLHGFDELAHAASADQDGVDRVLNCLARLTGGETALLEAGGSVVASDPGDASWAASAGDAGDDVERANVLIGREVVGTLLLRARGVDPALPRFAAALLTGTLARRRAALSAHRRLAEQVLEDVLRAVLPHDVAVRRLASFGMSFEDRNQVLVGRVSGTRQRALTSVPTNLGSMLLETDRPFLRAVLNGDVVVALPAGLRASVVARNLRAELLRGGGIATVGIGGAYAGPVGLRVSYAEAHTAADGGGVQPATPLSIAQYVRLEEPDAAIVEQSTYVLAPLMAHDAESASEGSLLLQTLEAFLSCDCSYPLAARELHVHPNTVRYRLHQIEQLTGHDLSSFLTRTHFWLALAMARHHERRRH